MRRENIFMYPTLLEKSLEALVKISIFFFCWHREYRKRMFTSRRIPQLEGEIADSCNKPPIVETPRDHCHLQLLVPGIGIFFSVSSIRRRLSSKTRRHSQTNRPPLLFFVTPQQCSSVLTSWYEAKTFIGPLDWIHSVWMCFQFQNALRSFLTKHCIHSEKKVNKQTNKFIYV